MFSPKPSQAVFLQTNERTVVEQTSIICPPISAALASCKKRTIGFFTFFCTLIESSWYLLSGARPPRRTTVPVADEGRGRRNEREGKREVFWLSQCLLVNHFFLVSLISEKDLHNTNLRKNPPSSLLSYRPVVATARSFFN